MLPLGRFEGFAVIKAESALQVLNKTSVDYAAGVRIVLVPSTALWHEFIGWSPPNTFIFKAEVSNTKVEFKFTIEKKYSDYRRTEF